ncbi:nicotinate-nucleotide adenylyltransferase [Gracilibacillus salitolerans]|uniref:Probable nicotinate-nucleotide adenylyltransferase n=1 Tax=Gracilibacillus salitolerans TaxID=2663022 RepID=A0A5Q2TJY3_9BACI|nr:nicotinate-nucleotide adenylyltransferase [Gracilibacillus salitolerans]QGH35036.1 nicotinate-nucleotide adenylyltransferase [Gracilibacillus salitolerans]
MKRIGLFGGTFDPPHYGHLLMAEQAYQQLALDEVWFIPSYQPPHKAEAKTTAKDRVEMTRAAVHDHPAFHVDTIEVEREGKSYTLNTIQTLREQYPAYQFYFIIGGDMVEYLPKWHRIEDLIASITFVGVDRPGSSMETPYPVEKVEMPLISISSTMIRGRISEGQSIRYLTTPEVIAIINKFELYS